MKVLRKKNWRDLLQMKAQVLSIALVAASGMGAFISSMAAYDSLKTAQARFYSQYRFAEAFAELKRAPAFLKEALSTIPGMGALQTRIVHDAVLSVPNLKEPALGRFISLPEAGELELNRLHLRRGRMPDPRNGWEALASEGFMKANGLRPGDAVTALLNGRNQTLTIVGVALSPEYVYAIRGGLPLPDDRRYGIFWVGEDALAAAFDLKGTFNSIAFQLSPQADARGVLAEVDRILEPYGGMKAYPRKDQLSNLFLSDEIRQQKVMAFTVPVIFLAVAAFLLHVVVSRMILMQREQIATLKAVGYSNREVAGHYAGMILAILAAAFAIGTGLGVWLGRAETALYTDFYHFPELYFTVHPGWIGLAAIATAAASFVGAATTLSGIFRLKPAEAMRPPAPFAFRRGLLEAAGILRPFKPKNRMVLRNLTARPGRTGMIILGLSFSFVVLMLGLFWKDAVDYIVQVQFSQAQREAVSVGFYRAAPLSALSELERMEGVIAAEGYRMVAVEAVNGRFSARTALVGLPRDARMRQLVNAEGRQLHLPPSGLAVSQALARKLKIRPGDALAVRSLEGKRLQWSLPVNRVTDDFIGLALYIERTELNGLLGEGDLISQASLITDGREEGLYERLKKLPAAGWVAIKRAALDSFRQSIARFILVFSAFLTGFALVIAVGVIYNSARVSLSERAWELASLRVLGFTRGEVFSMLAAELAFQLIPAVPIGLVLSYWFAALLVRLIHTETFTVPLVIDRSSYALAAVIVLGTAVASMALFRRRIGKLDLVGVLKTRE